ncbi:MAG: glycoside hydrolase family 16 protein, partial [Clostridium sp.]
AYGWPTCGEIDIMEMIGGPTDERLNLNETPAVKTGDQQSNKKIYGTPHFYWANTTDSDKDGSYGQNYNNASGGNATFRENLSNDFHIFGINWTETKIEWYVDNEIYNTIYFDDLTDAQMQAAKASLNRPQYIQLNLATGGNWAGDAGQYLAEDNTQFVIDWVKWSQNSEQEAAAAKYYEDMPTLTSKLSSDSKNITIVKGQTVDLSSYVQLNAENTSEQYEVRYSIDNEFMFVNNGIGPNATGQTKVQLVYSSTSANGLKKALTDLDAGVYNIHYTAVPKTTTTAISGKVSATSKLVRKTLKLVVLPKELTGVAGNKLSSVELPTGWSWENPEATLDNNVGNYNAVFTNTANDTNQRTTALTLSVKVQANQ